MVDRYGANRRSFSSVVSNQSGYETPPEDLEDLEQIIEAEDDDDDESPMQNKSVRFSKNSRMRQEEQSRQPRHSGRNRSSVFSQSEMSESQSHYLDEGSSTQFMSEDMIDEKTIRTPKRPKLGKGRAARLFRRYPRSCACSFGIVLPLWLLVAVSLFFGRFLGELESGGEISSNDQSLRQRILVETYNQALSNLLTTLPRTCYELYQSNTSIDSLNDAFQQILEAQQNLGGLANESNDTVTTKTTILSTSGDTGILNSGNNNDTGSSSGILIDQFNATDFAIYLSECGAVADTFKDYLREVWLQNFTSHSGSGNAYVDKKASNSGWKSTVSDPRDTVLSFHWIRCVNSDDVAQFNRIFIPSKAQLQQARHEEQERVYAAEWTQRQQELFQEYQESTSSSYNASVQSGGIRNGQLAAFNYSINEASGKDVCSPNAASAAWFWFSVMTTVGYGNQSPISAGGRAMVFTLGFLSIILFASVLSVAGTITSHLIKDLIHRIKIRFLVNKRAMIVVWGCLWTTWLWLLAYHFKTWNWFRLDVEVWWWDAYWYAYITLTTVGLGDYHIPSEVLFIGDLLAYSLSFLFGFVLLSAFLTELAQHMSENSVDVSTELGKRLKYVGVSKFFLDGTRYSLRQTRQGHSPRRDKGGTDKEQQQH